MTIRIVGAGFSGMTLAYYLVRRGVRVEIFERDADVGGLLHTRKNSFGLVETAANGIWNSALVEELFSDLQLPLAARLPSRRKRYIFRGRARRWPLGVFETMFLLFRLASQLLRRRLRPQTGESVLSWGERVGGWAFAHQLLAPALQGVYAGDPARMSAELILKKRNRNLARPKQKGTVTPAGGMGQLMAELRSWLEKKGVVFHFGVAADLQYRPLVLATSAWDAAEILQKQDPPAAALLKRVDVLPIVTVTQFYSEPPQSLRGFGCLFPAEEQFCSLGVLFNSDIFAGRGQRSETWILGGARRRDIAQCKDDEIYHMLARDRQRLFGQADAPVTTEIQRWPHALPHYTLEWQKILAELKTQPGLYLTGNYLGGIGLAKILQYNKDLAEKISG